MASDDTAPQHWPPDVAVSEARSKLLDRKDVLDVLAQRIIASPYTMISQQEKGNVEARRAGSANKGIETPSDTSVWSELLIDAGVKFAVRSNENEVHLSNVTGDQIILNGVRYNYVYIWSEKYAPSECQPQYASFRCGQCGERHGDKWTIEFAWAPAEIGEWSDEEARLCIAEFVSASDDLSRLP